MVMSAFPRDPTREQAGMTLRDWFAGQALGAVILQGERCGASQEEALLAVAEMSYDIADAMLKARDG